MGERTWKIFWPLPGERRRLGSGARDIRAYLRILDAIQESDRTGCRVQVDPEAISP